MSSLADRNAIEEVVAAIQRLPELHQVRFTLQLDAELPAHGA
jgi:hypothetical protein